MAPPAPEVVVDAGWLGYTGVGRLTEHLLRGLDQAGERAAPSDWAVWGPEAARPLSWTGATFVGGRHPPMQWGAQRDVGSIPPGRLLLSMHAVRPLAVWRPAVVYVQDTIPLRWDRASRRLAWRTFFTVSARSARRIIVSSPAAADRVVDLGVPARRIDVVTPAPDQQLVSRIREARDQPLSDEPPLLLYVGQIKPHKNLDRAVTGFTRSRFASGGGRFVIIGGGGEPERRAEVGVERYARVSEAELAAWYARSCAVILPSLEEGFGLPVIEALASGIPVCCSDIEPLRSVAQGQAQLFDPYDVDSIASAIDAAASSGPPDGVTTATEAEFAGQIRDVLMRAR